MAFKESLRWKAYRNYYKPDIADIQKYNYLCPTFLQKKV